MRHDFHKRHFYPGITKTSVDDRADKTMTKKVAKPKEQTFQTTVPLNNFLTRRQYQVSPRLTCNSTYPVRENHVSWKIILYMKRNLTGK